MVPRADKVCQLCKEKATGVDYKDTGFLKMFISDRGKIRPAILERRPRAVTNRMKTHHEATHAH